MLFTVVRNASEPSPTFAAARFEECERLFYHDKMPIPLNPKIVWIRDIDRDENGVPNAFRTERNTLEARRVFAELNRAVGTGSVIRVERRGDGYGLRYDRRLSDAELLRLESILRAKWIIQDPPVPPLKFSMDSEFQTKTTLRCAPCSPVTTAACP